ALALIGAALVAAAVWLPWATGTQTITVNGLPQTAALQISAGDVSGVLSLAPWSLVTIAGVLICVLLSIRGPRIVRLLLRICYLLWALAALAIITPTLLTLLTANPVEIRPDQGLPRLTVSHAFHLAMLLTYVGLVLALVASVFGLLDWRRSRETAGAAPVRSSATGKVPASGALTLSAVLFLIGIFVMPWATVNCTQTPLFIGQCTGVNFTEATNAGILAYANVFDALASRYAIPALLAGGALLLLLGVWRRGLFSSGGLWLVVWLLGATCFAVLGDLGAGALIANPSAYGLAAGKWSGDSGIVVAFLGLLIGWGAALYLGIVSLRARGTVSVEAA
ncbi:MAG: hypothetical protein ACRDHP_10870, partial [Ktedonobacterales bacterium]